MASYPMPVPETVASVLTDLLGKEVRVKLGKPFALRPGSPIIFSVFRNDQGQSASVMTCDLLLAAYTGAALALISTGVEQEVMKMRKLPDNLFENFREVVNIVGGTLFNSPTTPHLVLCDVLTSPGSVPAELKPVLTDPASWLFIDVSIEDYGNGKMTLLAASI
jgi:hypothetical protein